MSQHAPEAVTDYVFSTLEAAEALGGLQVLWGPPVGDDVAGEFVSIGFGLGGESWEADLDWIGIGSTKLDEEFELQLCTSVEFADGADVRPAFSRSFELASAVADVLRQDPHMKGVPTEGFQLRNVKLSRLRGRYFRTNDARGHRVFQTIAGIARI
jgi:hypothetical protein